MEGVAPNAKLSEAVVPFEFADGIDRVLATHHRTSNPRRDHMLDQVKNCIYARSDTFDL